MSPTINPPQSWFRDCLLVNKFIKPTHYRRGDVVLFKSLDLPNKTIVKRLVGLPGDFISFDDLFARGFVLVPKGYCWVEGDNEATSQDSRQFGPIPLGLLDGRVEGIIWPPHRASRSLAVKFVE
jgi:inner membrane protease subunit 2